MWIRKGGKLQLQKGGEIQRPYDTCATDVFRKRSHSAYSERNLTAIWDTVSFWGHTSKNPRT